MCEGRREREDGQGRKKSESCTRAASSLASWEAPLWKRNCTVTSNTDAILFFSTGVSRLRQTCRLQERVTDSKHLTLCFSESGFCRQCLYGSHSEMQCPRSLSVYVTPHNLYLGSLVCVSLLVFLLVSWCLWLPKVSKRRWRDYHDNMKERRGGYLWGRTVRREERDGTDESSQCHSSSSFLLLLLFNMLIQHVHRVLFKLWELNLIHNGGTAKLTSSEDAAQCLSPHQPHSHCCWHTISFHVVGCLAQGHLVSSSEERGEQYALTFFKLGFRTGGTKLPSATFTFTDFFHTSSSLLHPNPTGFLSPLFSSPPAVSPTHPAPVFFCFSVPPLSNHQHHYYPTLPLSVCGGLGYTAFHLRTHSLTIATEVTVWQPAKRKGGRIQRRGEEGDGGRSCRKSLLEER